jgi:histidinol dehydrogenase
VDRVRREGDAALRAMALQYDGATLDRIEVPEDRIRDALNGLPPDLRRAMSRAAANIARVHENSVPPAREIETEPGVLVGRRPDPLDSVGVYAPGGRASYPSSVLMGVIPARCAGVRQIVLCSPPDSDGLPPAPILAAAAIADVDRVFAIGGAGAIAAMAIGTESVPRTDKIVGPGNVYVAEAKLQLSGTVAFDSPAGPSELLVIADDESNPERIAREMLAQAEHDPLAAVVAVCASEAFALKLLAAVERSLHAQTRVSIIAEALGARGAILWSASRREVIDFACEYAPEHLLIAASDASDICSKVRNAGTIFLGESSSVSFGDYMTGANHVLPTGTLARSYSGLSTLDFVRWTTYQRISESAAAALADDVATFARAEMLPAHAAAAAAWRRGTT